MLREPNIHRVECVQLRSKKIEKAGNCGLKLQLLSSNETKQRQLMQRVPSKTDSAKKPAYEIQMELLGIHVSSNKLTKVSLYLITKCILFHVLERLIGSDTTLPPFEVRSRIESIARVSAQADGPPPTKHSPSSPVIPPHNPQGTASNNISSSKSAGEASLISFDDDSDEFVDAQE